MKIENSALKTRNARLKSKLKTKFSKLENDAINKELELIQDLEVYKAKVKEKNIANEYRYNKLVQNLKFFKDKYKEASELNQVILNDHNSQISKMEDSNSSPVPPTHTKFFAEFSAVVQISSCICQ